jgi:hypothetical protein
MNGILLPWSKRKMRWMLRVLKSPLTLFLLALAAVLLLPLLAQQWWNAVYIS